MTIRVQVNQGGLLYGCRRMSFVALLSTVLAVSLFSPFLFTSLAASATTTSASRVLIPFLSSVPALAANTATTSITAAADSYVNSRYPTSNYGSASELVTTGSPIRQNFVRFNTSTLAQTILSAKLRLYVMDGSGAAGGTVLSINDTTWSESAVTYNTRPTSNGVQVGSFNQVAAGGWIEHDVTSVVRAPGVYSFGISQTGTDSVVFASREHSTNSYRPQLVITTSGTSTSNPSPAPSTAPPTAPSPSPMPSSMPTPTPSPAMRSGIWISQAEIMARPMSGDAWTAMKQTADTNIGSANIADQNLDHSTRTLAVALVYARTGNESYRTKAINALLSAIGTENNTDPNCGYTRSDRPAGARSMSVGRNLIGYVVAADVLNFRTGGYDPDRKGTQFQNWVNQLRYRDNCPNTGSGSWPNGDWYNLSQTHDQAASNGNTMAGASRIAAAAYLGDKVELDKAWLTYRRYTGDHTVGPNFRFNDQTWISSATVPVAINPAGATCNGTRYPADGAMPNDQSRGGNCPSDPNTAPGYTQYPWEGLQGIYAQAVILDRLSYKDPSGNNPWTTQNNALLRATQYQWYLQSKFGGSWYDSKRAAWVKHLAYYVYGYKPISYAPSGGRNMDWTQWTHMK